MLKLHLGLLVSGSGEPVSLVPLSYQCCSALLESLGAAIVVENSQTAFLSAERFLLCLFLWQYSRA